MHVHTVYMHVGAHAVGVQNSNYSMCYCSTGCESHYERLDCLLGRHKDEMLLASTKQYSLVIMHLLSMSSNNWEWLLL